MKWIHPQIVNLAVVAAVVGLVSATGCRNGSGASPNPFLAPDRVPPPATRALAPGQAQPYYPGDPLPVMQSAVAPPAPAMAANAPPADGQSTGDTALAWTAPAAAPTGASTDSAADARPSGWSNEPLVAVPQDSDALRFALAPPSTAPATTAAAATPPPVPFATMPATSQGVVPASFSEPVVSNSGGILAAPNDYGPAPAALPTGPWRSPQISLNPQNTSGSGAAFPATGAPTTAPPNSIDVRLRAVSSPPLEPLESTTPRIRLPGYPAPPQLSAAALQPAPLSTAMLPGGLNGSVQTVQATALAPSPFVAPGSVSPTGGSTVSSDGFRPRGSIR